MWRSWNLNLDKLIIRPVLLVAILYYFPVWYNFINYQLRTKILTKGSWIRAVARLLRKDKL